MLSQLRSASKTWIAALFILLLAGSFLIFGVEDVFRTPVENTVAEIDDIAIEAQAVRREFDSLRSRLGGGEEPIPTEQALAFGLDRMAVDQLISRAVLDKKARDLGLTTADSVLAGEIRASDSFAGPTGSFDEQLYRELLSINRLTPAMFEASVRDDLTRTQLVDAVAAGFRTPRGLADALYRFTAERRRVTYLAVAPSVVSNPPEPEEGDLQTLYDAESFRFTIPETRSFTVLALSPVTLAETVDVNEDRLRAEYEFRKESFLKPESRRVRQVVFDDADAAAKARNRIAEGGSLVDIAAERGLTQDDIDLGDLTRDGFFDAAVAEGVFALPAPGVTPVIEGSLGFVIAEVTAINAGQEKAFEEVADDLRGELAIEQASDVVNDLIDRVEDGRAMGQTLEEIGEALNIAVVSVEGVTQRGQTVDGEQPDGLPQDPAIVSIAYDSEIGLDNPFEPLADGGYFLLRLDDVTPSSVKPFEAVRDEVETLWRQQRTRSLLTEEAQTLAERVRTGETFETVAADIDGRVVTPVEPIDRTTRDEVLSDSLITDLFKAPEGGIVIGPARDGVSQVVAQVTEIVPAPEETADTAIRTIRSRLDETMESDAVQVLVGALRKQYDVEVNDRALADAVGRTVEGAAIR
ncbi:MAG: SurA N-terminal domain-containing protein [Alphaproteobacteria bacterium]